MTVKSTDSHLPLPGSSPENTSRQVRAVTRSGDPCSPARPGSGTREGSAALPPQDPAPRRLGGTEGLCSHSALCPRGLGAVPLRDFWGVNSYFTKSTDYLASRGMKTPNPKQQQANPQKCLYLKKRPPPPPRVPGPSAAPALPSAAVAQETAPSEAVGPCRGDVCALLHSKLPSVRAASPWSWVLTDSRVQGGL